MMLCEAWHVSFVGLMESHSWSQIIMLSQLILMKSAISALSLAKARHSGEKGPKDRKKSWKKMTAQEYESKLRGAGF